jgi:two-component system response regulator
MSEILLIEDNPNDVQLTLHTLDRHRVADRVQVLRDGAEAIDFFFGHSPPTRDDVPRVILLDLKLPRVDGLEVLRWLKSDPRTSCIPIVVLTSSREERDIIETYRRGVNSYIVKPVDFEQFVEAVRQLSLYWVLLNQAQTV